MYVLQIMKSVLVVFLNSEEPIKRCRREKLGAAAASHESFVLTGFDIGKYFLDLSDSKSKHSLAL